MPTAAEKLQKRIDVQLAKLAKLDEQIGRLMSRRVFVEGTLAQLYEQRNRHVTPTRT